MLLKPELFNKDAEKKALALLINLNPTVRYFCSFYAIFVSCYFVLHILLLRIYDSHSTVLYQITDFKSHKHHKMNLTSKWPLFGQGSLHFR
jgi:hypothetical protein